MARARIEPNMPEKVYRDHIGINISTLNKLSKSPAHCLHAILNPSEPTKDMMFGTRVHHALFQKESFAEKYVIPPEKPKFDARTKEGKEIKAEYEELYAAFETSVQPHQEIITFEDLTEVQKCAEAIQKHPKVEQLLDKVDHVEVSLFLQRTDTELLKGRIDAYSKELDAIIDLKTTYDSSPDKWMRTSYDRGYHRQAAWYLMLAQECGLPAKRFFHIVAETSEPYATSVFLLRPELIELGHEENKKLLSDYLGYVKESYWPPYSEELLELGIPSWAIKRSMEAA